MKKWDQKKLRDSDLSDYVVVGVSSRQIYVLCLCICFSHGPPFSQNRGFQVLNWRVFLKVLKRSYQSFFFLNLLTSYQAHLADSEVKYDLIFEFSGPNLLIHVLIAFMVRALLAASDSEATTASEVEYNPRFEISDLNYICSPNLEEYLP